jgi:hypothetical protein
MGPPSTRGGSTRRNPFVLIVTGDRRLGPEHYSRVKFRLDCLLTRHLPHVRLLSSSTGGADALGVRWAEAHQLEIERFQFDVDGQTRNPDLQAVEWMLQRRPSGLVVFAGQCHTSSELERRARVMGTAVRVVDLSKLLA